MKISDLFIIVVFIFWFILSVLFISGAAHDLIDPSSLLLLFTIGITLWVLIKKANAGIKPLIFGLAFVVIVCHLQRILMLLFDPSQFVSTAATIINLDNLKATFAFLLLAIIASGAGVILAQIFARRSAGNPAGKQQAIYYIRSVI